MSVERSAILALVATLSACAGACNHTGVSTEISIDGASKPDASATANALDAESTSDGQRQDDPCECDMLKLYSQSGTIAPTPLAVGEHPDRGYVAGLGWRETPSPKCAEGLKCMRPTSLDEDQLARFWNRYRIIRSARVLPGCAHDVRIVIDFTTKAGADYWLAIGRGLAYGTAPISGTGTAFMETEGHVCHPLDATLFRQVVDLLDIRRDVMTDPDYRKYL